MSRHTTCHKTPSPWWPSCLASACFISTGIVFKETSGRFLVRIPFLMSWPVVERVSRCSMMQRYFSFLGQSFRNRRPKWPWKRTRSILSEFCSKKLV